VDGGVAGPVTELTLHGGGTQSRGDLNTATYTATLPGRGADGQPGTLPAEKVAALNGGRLPLGTAQQAGGELPVSYTDRNQVTVQVEPRTGRVVDVSWTEQVTASLVSGSGLNLALGQPVAQGSAQLPPESANAALAAAHRDLTHDHQRVTREHTAAGLGIGALAALALAVALRALVAERHLQQGIPGSTAAA
jgi:high-affinity iron transporter